VTFCRLEPKIEPVPFGVTDRKLAMTGRIRTVDRVRQPAQAEHTIVPAGGVPARLGVRCETLL
jgi:hypothetical protein